MFLYEDDLKRAFWKNYNYNNRAVIFQFESDFRGGNIDLVTIEKYQEKWQINAFEFKIDDIKKVLLQAKYNIQFCTKSWAVIPIEKENLINDKYINYLQENKSIGVIGVDENGKWKIIYQPTIFNEDIILTQKHFSLMINKM